MTSSPAKSTLYSASSLATNLLISVAPPKIHSEARVLVVNYWEFFLTCVYEVPFAFASFADQPPAVAAMHELNARTSCPDPGMVFDLEKGSTLYIDLAKFNACIKFPCWRVLWILDGSPDSDQSHGGHILLKAHIAGFGSVHLPGMTISAFNTIVIPICTKFICTS
ncbi:hypothetical protein NC651_013537 [Populus alba x Populus x berolinensis]|nr:hypothetical protein NC651_013537 [Populus alba x Populus x berolinensis]